LSGPLIPGCDSLNGVYTLSSSASRIGLGIGAIPSLGGFWGYVGAEPFVCLHVGSEGGIPASWPAAALLCLDEPQTGMKAGSFEFSTPAPGMLFLLFVPQSEAGWQIPIVGHPPQWSCAVGASAIPYFCPFNEIECLQPITLSQLPYTVWFPFPLPNSCQGWPGAVTVAPLP
jgi:hypothetical protein